MKGAKTAAGNQRGQSPSRQPERDKAAARKPIGTEPASPMKSRAGGKLNGRNAAPAAATMAHSISKASSPLIQAPAARNVKPVTVMPPASPSEPSMKLYRFVIHKMPITIRTSEGSATAGRA